MAEGSATFVTASFQSLRSGSICSCSFQFVRQVVEARRVVVATVSDERAVRLVGVGQDEEILHPHWGGPAPRAGSVHRRRSAPWGAAAARAASCFVKWFFTRCRGTKCVSDICPRSSGLQTVLRLCSHRLVLHEQTLILGQGRFLADFEHIPVVPSGLDLLPELRVLGVLVRQRLIEAGAPAPRRGWPPRACWSNSVGYSDWKWDTDMSNEGVERAGRRLRADGVGRFHRLQQPLRQGALLVLEQEPGRLAVLAGTGGLAVLLRGSSPQAARSMITSLPSSPLLCGARRTTGSPDQRAVPLVLVSELAKPVQGPRSGCGPRCVERECR